MSDDGVRCDQHGEGLPYGFVCGHLARGEGPGWVSVPGPDPDDADDPEGADRRRLCPDAWCEVCDALRDPDGSWSDSAAESAEIQVICAVCYHARRGAGLRPSGLDATSDVALLRDARATMEARTDTFVSDRALSDEEPPTYNLDYATLRLADTGGAASTFAMAALGTHSAARGGSWLLAAANAWMPTISGARSAALTGYAGAVGLPDLGTDGAWATLEQARARASLVAVLLDALAVIEVPEEDGMTMFFGVLGEET